MELILFDFDVVVYRAAFANQHTSYRIEGQEMSSAEAVALNLETGLEVEKIIEPAPKSYALGTARSIINAVTKKFNIEKYIGYLSSTDPEDHFRLKIEGNKPYKANRKKIEKPFYYDEVREYLINNHDAIVVKGEADDALGIEQTKYGLKSVVVSIDKDLLQIPGNHYNTMSNKLIVSFDPGMLYLDKQKSGLKCWGTGFKFFCAQMMLGDTADNIEGLVGYGPKKVFTILEQLKKIDELWGAVVSHYEIMRKTEQNLWGTANLLWIRRQEGQTFNQELIKELHENILG